MLQAADYVYRWGMALLTYNVQPATTITDLIRKRDAAKFLQPHVAVKVYVGKYKITLNLTYRKPRSDNNSRGDVGRFDFVSKN